MISDKVRRYKLGQICTKIGSGATPKGGKEAYLPIGEISLIRSQNVLDFSFSKEGLAFINKDQASKLNNVTVETDDVLLNITGDSVARVCQVPSDVLPARVNQHVAIIRPKKETLDNAYLKYYLLNPTFKDFMLGLSSVGGTRNALTKVMIEDFEINVPELETQKQIASILSSLDNKIELNRQTNQTIEAIAQAIFKEWFVDFNFPAATGEMEESELGMIPKGWRVGYLSELFDFLEGPGLRHWQYRPNGIRFINIRLINNNDINIKGANFVSIEEVNTKYSHFLLQPKDMVVSTSGTLGRTAIVRDTHLPLMLNTSVIRFRPHDFSSYAFMYQFLNSQYFYSELLANASGSVQLNFGPSHLKKMTSIIPPTQLINKYSKMFDCLYGKIGGNLDEINALIELRDTLLPKLMKGEISINN